jgi:hypothetical protein
MSRISTGQSGPVEKAKPAGAVRSTKILPVPNLGELACFFVLFYKYIRYLSNI